MPQSDTGQFAELEQQRLAVATEGIAAELEAFGRYLAQAGFSATIRARHAQAARQVQARLAELKGQLDTLIREPIPANLRPLADTLAAGSPAAARFRYRWRCRPAPGRSRSGIPSAPVSPTACW